MKKEFLINLSFLIAVNLLVKPFFIFGIDLSVQNLVGAADYGWYFSLFSFSFLFSILGDLGLQQYNNRRIAQHSYLLDKYFSTFLLIKVLLAGLMVSVAFGVAWAIGYRWASIHLLSFLLLNQVLIGLILFLRSNISGLQKYRLDSFVSVLDKLLMILFCSILIWGPWRSDFKIEWFVYAQTLAYALTMLAALFIVGRYLKERIRFKWRWTTMRAILRQTGPYALTVFLMAVYLRVDSVMIERLLPNNVGEYQAGIYAAGYRLLDAVNIIGLLFASLLLPMFAKMIKDKEDIASLTLLSFQLLMTITVSFSVTTAFWSSFIADFMYVENATAIAPVLAILILCFNIMGASYVFTPLLTANDNMREMNRIFSVGVLFNIALNYILIQRHGALGAALTTLVTQTGIILAELVLVYRVFKFSLSLSLWFRLSLFVGLVIGINWGVFYFIDMHWMLGYVICGACSVLAALMTRILEVRSILSVFRAKPT